MNLKATVFLILFLGVIPAAAENVTITFSDLQLIKGTKIVVYDHLGNYVGEYNTTDTITLDLNDSKGYIFVLKPTEQVWFQNPLNALELFKASIPPMLSYLLFAVVIICGGYLLTRIFR